MGKLATGQVTKTNGGFTLIELMVVVVIVAILLGLAVPAYQDSIRKGRRTDARNALMAAQLVQEKYRGNNSSYGTTAQTGLATTSESGYYTIAVVNPTATSYTVTATPVAGKSQEGDSCGTFAIGQSGPDTSGSYAGSDCW